MFRPRSILQLILVGFGVVTIPLIVALVTAAVFVEELTQTGQQVVFKSADAIQSTRVLMEAVRAMERNARQYLVLDDRSLFQVYLQRRQDYLSAVGQLRSLGLTSTQRTLLDDLRTKEQQLYAQLQLDKAVRPPNAQIGAEFTALGALARAILGESGDVIARGVKAMRTDAARVQRILVWETMAVIPGAVVLSALFIVLIARPLRQLGQGIRQLGDGEFDRRIDVSGPHDLEELGNSLDWMRRRLVDLENQKTLFLRHISHELKTPLTTIREGTELLKEQVVGTLNPQQQEIAVLLRQNCLLLQRLIEDLLDFNLSRSSPHPLLRKTLRLDRLLREVIEGHKLAARARGLAFELHLDEVNVQGDGDKLKAVFDNLISNAVKFSPSGAPIVVSLSVADAWVEVDIADSGPGIAPDEREHVFEAFYQGRAPAKGHVKGSGLGLSIAQEYVRLHKGTIHVVDTQQGAHLRVRLPWTAQDDSTAERPASADIPRLAARQPERVRDDSVSPGASSPERAVTRIAEHDATGNGGRSAGRRADR